jgi:hypothetical protein
VRLSVTLVVVESLLTVTLSGEEVDPAKLPLRL